MAANLYNRPHFVGQFWVGVAAWPAVYQYYVYDPRRNDTPPLGGFERQPPDEQANRTGLKSTCGCSATATRPGTWPGFTPSSPAC